jgi:hypothetical protein
MLPRKAYIPKSAFQAVNIEKSGIEVWLYTDSRTNQPYAIAFHGRCQKPDWNFRFANEAARDKKIEDWLAGLESWSESKKERRATNSQPTSLEIGDILHGSWGYDQTQCDYFQVVGKKGKRGVYVRKIAAKTVEGSQGYMSDSRLPVKDSFLNSITTFHIATGDTIRYDPGEYYERDYPGSGEKDRHYSASKWDGSPNYCSWYA